MYNIDILQVNLIKTAHKDIAIMSEFYDEIEKDKAKTTVKR